MVVLPGEGVYLSAERGSIALRGLLYEKLAPLLDGTLTTDDIVDALSATTPAADVYYAIDRLMARGYVCDGGLAGPPQAAGFWGAMGLDAALTASRLQAASVAVMTVGAVDRAPLIAALGGAGLAVAPDGALTVVATDDYLQPDLAAINAQALAGGRAWLLCKPAGTRLWVGPLFRPGESACWECLATRLRGHRAVEAEVQARTGASDPLVLPRSAVAGSEDVALSLAALWAAGAIASPDVRGEAAVITLDLQTLATERHVVVRRPQCMRCGQPLDPDRAPQPPRLDGEHPPVAPDTTFARYRHHISPITGLVSELRAVSADDRPSPLHVWRAAGGVAWGKGTTAAQARTAALCEALEMLSGRFYGDEPRVRASFRSLGDRAIHPNACMLLSDQQYARREEWNAAAGWFRYIPERFDEEAEIDWVYAWSMTRGTFRLLPAEYCCYGHPSRPARALADPNGQGAGNTIEEAILHALLELVERDAAAIWWFNRLRRPPVDIDGFDDPVVHAVRAHTLHEGRELWALDLTADLGIPVFAAISRACDGPERISFGFGAALDPRVALVRALGEMHQLACTLAEAKDRWLRQWWETATIAEHSYLAPLAPACLTPDADVATRRAPVRHRASEIDTMAAIAECRGRLEQQGLETLVIDQTRPDIGLPTVRVIVPGLRHWRPPRYAAGRLYDVPVRLGWLAGPLREDQLNPLFPPA